MKMPHGKDLVLLSMVAVGAGFAAMLFGVGCEIAPANEKIVVTPSSSLIAIFGEQEFTASGGYDYTWSLQNDDWGILSTRTGDKTTYTSLYDPGSETRVQILTVVSTISQAQNTNASSYYQTAEAYVTHLSSLTTLRVTPASATAVVGDEITFAVSGGADYTWRLKYADWGRLSTTNGSQTSYTSIRSPDEGQVLIQILTADSSDGSEAYAVITHQWQYQSVAP